MDIVVVGVLRTPNGKFKGGLAAVPTVTLGGLAISVALERAGLSAAAVDTVVMGNLLQAGLSQWPASQATVVGGLGWDVTLLTEVNPLFTVQDVLNATQADLVISSRLTDKVAS